MNTLITILSNKYYCLILTLFCLFSFKVNAVEYHTFSLENGLEVNIIVTPSKHVTQAIVYNTGLANQSLQERGAALAVEQLMYKGTNKYPESDFMRELNHMGIVYGSEVTLNYSMYYMQSHPDFLSETLKIEADRSRWLNITQEKINQQKLEMRNRLNAREKEPQKLLQLARSLIFNHSRYDSNLTANNIERLSVESVTNFYKKWYRVDNAKLIIIGNVDVKQTERLVKRYFAFNQNYQEKTNLSNSLISTNVKDYSLDINYSSKNIHTKTYIKIYTLPASYAVAPGHLRDTISLDVIAEYLSNPANYFYQSLIDNNIIYDIQVNYYNFEFANPVFTVVATLNENATKEQAKQAISRALHMSSRRGFTQEEIDRIANLKIDQLEFYKTSHLKLLHYIVPYLNKGISIEGAFNINLEYTKVNQFNLNANFRYLLSLHNISLYISKE